MRQGLTLQLCINGGDEEDRTPDLRIANAALSQLSYVPTRGAIIAESGTARKLRRLLPEGAAGGARVPDSSTALGPEP